MEINGIMKYRCIPCKLDYETYNGLWKHNKVYHKNNKENITPIMSKIPHFPSKKEFLCKFCNKNYSRNDNLKRHQKLCVKKEDIYEIKIKSLEDKVKQLETKCNKKKITNNNNNNNGVINNITINKIGSEKLHELTKNEISTIFNKELESIFTFVEMINFNNRLKENHSFCTTNLESKFLSTYNDETKTIDKERKKYFFDKLLDTSIERIEILYNSNKNIFNSKKQKQIEDNINNIKELKNYSFESKIFKEITNKFNLLSYNKRKLVQKTWNDDPDSDGETFQDDLNKIESIDDPEYIEYLNRKNKAKMEVPEILRYKFTGSSDTSSDDEN
jgi:hypothetical protein